MGKKRVSCVGPPYWESAVLTVPVPGSVAGTHRRTEMVQKTRRCNQYKTQSLIQTFKRFLHNGSQAANLLHGGSIRGHPNHKQKFGRRRNPNYSSSSTSKSPSASSAEKHGIGGVSTLRTQQVPSFKQEFYLDAWGKTRKRLGFWFCMHMIIY